MNAIDTNVLVYWVDDSADEKQLQAGRLIDQLVGTRQRAVLLWQVAVEFLNCMRRWELAKRISRAQTVAYLEEIESAFDLRLPTRSVIHTAMDLNTRHSPVALGQPSGRDLH